MTTICSRQDQLTPNAHQDEKSAITSRIQSLPAVTRDFTHKVLQRMERRREQRDNRDAFAHLLKLDDSLLRDIGVSRAEVENAARLPLTEDAAKALYNATGRCRD